MTSGLRVTFLPLILLIGWEMLNLPARALIPICFFNHGLNSSKACSFFIFSGLAWQAGEAITASVGESGMII